MLWYTFLACLWSEKGRDIPQKTFFFLNKIAPFISILLGLLVFSVIFWVKLICITYIYIYMEIDFLSCKNTYMKNASTVRSQLSLFFIWNLIQLPSEKGWTNTRGYKDFGERPWPLCLHSVPSSSATLKAAAVRGTSLPEVAAQACWLPWYFVPFHHYLRRQRANIDLTPSKRPIPPGLPWGRSPTRAGRFEFHLILFSKTRGQLLAHLKTEEIHFPFQMLHLFCLRL